MARVHYVVRCPGTDADGWDGCAPQAPAVGDALVVDDIKLRVVSRTWSLAHAGGELFLKSWGYSETDIVFVELRCQKVRPKRRKAG